MTDSVHVPDETGRDWTFIVVIIIVIMINVITVVQVEGEKYRAEYLLGLIPSGTCEQGLHCRHHYRHRHHHDHHHDHQRYHCCTDGG